jgi:hypothetical protein
MRISSNGRARRSEPEWQAIFSRFATSGLTAREFCRNEDVNLASFQRWHRKLVGDSSVTERFVELAEPAALAPEWQVELTLPGGRVLRIRG